MEYIKICLQQFTEAPTGTTGAESAGTTAETTGSEAPLQAGDTLPDGTKIGSSRVAAEMEKQMRKHPELRERYGRGGKPQPAPTKPQADAQAEQATQNPGADELQSRWEAAKKGEFAELYGKDVQAAIQDRFKNQKNLQGQLDELEPALKVLRERAGVESNSDLVKQIMDDDSLYEEAANEAGMTVEAYKEHLKLVQERDQYKREHNEQVLQQQIDAHYQKLVQQSQALKQEFPDFDLQKELRENPHFKRITAPDIGMSVRDAFFATHHDELAPQMMAYGMQRAKQQMAQNLQANAARPREGGLGSRQNAAADMKLDPRSMTRKERDAIRAQIHAGRKITFD